jgi:hypothetical protein
MAPATDVITPLILNICLETRIGERAKQKVLAKDIQWISSGYHKMRCWGPVRRAICSDPIT